MVPQKWPVWAIHDIMSAEMRKRTRAAGHDGETGLLAGSIGIQPVIYVHSLRLGASSGRVRQL